MTPEQIIEQEKARSGAGGVEMAPTPDTIIAREKERLANSASGSFYTMRETQPERASKVISLSDRLGAERDFVDRNLETMEEAAAEDERRSLLAQFPKVAQFFSDPYRAAEAKDSVSNFAEIEKAFAARQKASRPKGWLEAPFSQTGDLARSAAGEFVNMFGMGVRGAGDLTGAYVNTMRGGANMVPGLREGLAELDRVEAEIAPEAKNFAPQNYLRTAGGGVSELGEIIKPKDMGFEDKVAGALGQIVGAVITTVAGGPGASAGLFMGMGADQQGQAMRNAGLNPDEMLPELVAGAGITGLSEQLRLGSIMRIMPKEARQKVVSKMLARVAGQAGEEAVQESVEGILQNVMTTTYDADASVFDGIAEQATTAGAAAAIFQTLVEVALPGKQRGVRAETNAQELMDIREAIEQTPVFQRSRESIEAFLQQAGEGETILLHSEDLVELYQSAPQEFLQRMDEVGLTEDDISRAMDGHDIEVEAAKILSVSEGFEDWVKIAKADGETPTLRELERSVEDSDAMGAVDFTEAFERIAKQDEALEGFERVQSAVTEQLVTAGRGQAEAEAAGVVWGAMFRQLAEAGVDEGAVFDRLGLRINEPAAPRLPKPQEPQSLHSFIRELGGIRESFGEDQSGHLRGEVDARLGERVPGLINNASGVTLDEIFRAATEEGGFEIRDEQDLLDLLDQDLSGNRVYPVGEAEVYSAELDAYEAQFEKPDGEVMDQAAEAGYEGSDRGEASEWLAASQKGLDMSQEARMARAREMGFDTEQVLYHGTGADFQEFLRVPPARSTSADSARAGVWMTDSAQEAAEYGELAAQNLKTNVLQQRINQAERRGDWDEVNKLTQEWEASDAAGFDGEMVLPLVSRGSLRVVDLGGKKFSEAGNEIWQAINAAQKEGVAGVRFTNIVDPVSSAVPTEPTTHTLIFDPSNIRSVNAAFDPNASESANLLAQNPPRSLFAAMKMDPQDRADWYDRIVDERKVGTKTILTLKADTRNLIDDDVVIAIENGIDVEFTADGMHANRDSAPTPEDIAKGARVMAMSTAALQEWMLRNDSPFVGFTGATEAHNRLYESMLGRFDFDGYLGYKTHDYRAMLNVEADGTKIADADPYDSAPGFMIVKDGYLEQAKYFLKSRQDGLAADATAFGEYGAGIITKRLGSTVPLERRSRRVGGPDSGGNSDGRGSGVSGDGQAVSGSDVGLTPIRPQQRELFQSAQQKARPSEVGVEIPNSNGLVAIRTDDLGFTNSAEKAMFDPPPRFRDAQNMTKDQWRKYFKEAGATKEAFEFIIEPALKDMSDKGDLRKADVIKAVRANRPDVRANDTVAKKLKPWQQEALDVADDPIELARLGKRAERFVRDYEAGLKGEHSYSEYISPGPATGYRQELIVDPSVNYSSHNWSSRGVLAHIRMTIRQIVTGEKVMHADELQSDLHQEGAQYGYRGDPSSRAERQQAYMDAQAAHNRAIDRWTEWAERKGLPQENIGNPDRAGTSEMLDDTGRELVREYFRTADVLSQVGEATRKGNRQDTMRPPRAPMKDWEKPAIRRILQRAMEEDVDLVTFTSFDTLHNALQTADGTRNFYDERLPKHIRKVAKQLGAKVERAVLRQEESAYSVQRMKDKITALEERLKLAKEDGNLNYGDPSTIRRTIRGLKHQIRRSEQGGDAVLAIRLTPEAKQKLQTEGNVLFQSNDIHDGFYSALERKVSEIKMDRAPVDQWISTIENLKGIKKEELEWTGILDMLRARKEEHDAAGRNQALVFEKADIVSAIQQKGVKIETIEATEDGSDEGVTFGASEVWEDPEAWEWRIDDEVDWIAESEGESIREEATREVAADDQQYIEDAIGEDASEEAVLEYARQEFADEIEQKYQDILRERAEESAKASYYDDPTYIIPIKDGEGDQIGMLLGNDNSGWDVRASMHYRDVVRNDIWSQAEAEVQAREWAAEEGYAGGEVGRGQRAQWMDYVTDGPYENYREFKITLPEVPGEFVEESHFTDPNIVAWGRTTDRDLIVNQHDNLDARVKEIAETLTEDASFDIRRTKAGIEQSTALIERGRKELEALKNNERAHPSEKYSVQDEVDRYIRNRAEHEQDLIRQRANWDSRGRDQHALQMALREQEVSAFYIDEAQSDWHQQGRQGIYDTPEERARRDEMEDDLQSKLGSLSTEINEFGRRYSELREKLFDGGSVSPKGHDVSEDYKQIASENQNRYRIGLKKLGVELNPNYPNAMEEFAKMVDSVAHGVNDFNTVFPDAESDGLIREMVTIATEQYKRRSERRALELQLDKVRGARAVPNAPFKGDAWINLLMKKMILQAVGEGKDAIAWADAQVVKDRWSGRYAELYENMYDKKMVKAAQKLVGAKAKHMDLDGGEKKSQQKRTDMYVQAYDRLTDEGDVLRIALEENNTDAVQAIARDVSSIVTNESVSGQDLRIGRELNEELFAWVRSGGWSESQGYWIIELTPEMRGRIKREGFPLFQGQDKQPRASVLIPGGGVLTDQNVIVNLLKKKDRTSFMHESAHIFLELYAALESENEAIAERMAAIRKWLKIEPGEKITRDQHEKFAESFEAYLMEGVAPSAELRSVFHSFRQWFVDVYRRLRGQLRNLEPEARDIFDRMLASDAEIEMAQGQYVGTLSNVMAGLMKPEQVEKYQKHARKAGNVARDRLFKKHMEEVKRRERKAYQEEQGRVEDMVRAQMAEWPEYKALTAFGEGGRSLDVAESPESTKLNTSENGEHPEIVAPEMGFLSADEMFKAVAKVPSPEVLIRESVKKIMGDRYGDMLRDGTIEAEAMEAVFNEPTIRMMEAERNALAEKGSAQPIPLIAIRHEADRLISSMPIDQVIKPGRYAIKARDLHKKSLRAAARGKWDDALRYTHQAMLQHELARRAFKARDEIEKANRYLAKFAPNRKLDPKKINPDHIAKIRILMAMPGAADQAEARKELQDFAEKQAEQGLPIVLPFDVAQDRDLPLRRRMTMEQFREFRDSIKNLNTVGRQQSAIALAEFNDEAQALADEIDANFKGKRIRETRNPTRTERASRIGRQIDATIIRWPFLVESLQGGKVGKIVEAFDTRLRQALTNRNARRQKMADELAAIFKKHGISQNELNSRVSAPAIEAGAVKFEQIMAIALNMGTEQNRDRLAADPSMLGDMTAIEAMLAEHLEQRHWDAAQEVWDLINTLWPDASAVERTATGVTPKKVEASSVQTKFGAYRGGYYPLKYDRAFLTNNDLQKKDEIEEWKNGVNGMATRASTRQGFLKERQQNVERPLDLSLGVILSHIDDVTNDIYMREPASYVSRMLNKNRIRKAIKETQGEEYLKTLETILKRTVTGTEQPDTAFEKFLQTLRINASVAILGGNVVTAGLAPISYFQTVIPQYGFKTVFAGIAEYYANPIKNAKLIVEKSAFMRERQDTLTREAHELIRRSAGQSRFAKVQGAGYWMMAIAEKHSVSGPLWIGVYNQAKSEGSSEADAITAADRAVSTTQGSGLEIDQSVMQGGNEGLRLLSFMWGYVSGYYGTVRNDVVSEQGLKKLMPLVKHMVFLNLVASMLEALIRGGFGDEEDPYVVAVWQMMMRNTFGLIPGVSSAVSKYDSGPAAFQVGTSITRATENWAKAGTQIYEEGEAEGETVRRATLETLKAGGFLFGVPGTVQAMKAEKTFAEDDDPTLYEAIVSGPDDDN